MTERHLQDRHKPRRAPLLALLIGALAFVLLAACGSGSAATNTTVSSSGASTAVSGAATSVASAVGTGASGVQSTVAGAATRLAGSPMASQLTGPALQLATCVQQNTTGQVVTDLRAGNTTSAEGVYKTCVQDALPAPLAAQADPIIKDAATCGQQTAQAMSQADITAAENGDTAKIQMLSEQTVTCLSNKYGGLLQ